ncbi:MAG: sigma-54-dependent Fis family transcriptional regulator, partial [Myxococcus sp.]|nr:sigma-54-dependent Fis family transcriptional regulator [Myxococcus sp.]
ASRAHAEVRATAQGVVVRDLGSTNGTAINGVRVTEALLERGMTALLGGTAIVIEDARDEVLPMPQAGFGALVGASAPMRALFRELARVAPTNATVLVEAESGCGKELLARSLHDASPRAAEPFVVFDCAACAPSLIESALFGHERGAFTGATARKPGVFEAAHGGTLFLDEVGELPLELQPRLLRALESREVRRVGGQQPIPVDIRVVAATNRDLLREMNGGAFREDLYFRLAVVRLRIPPLRERLDDLPLLVEHLVREQVGPDERRLRIAMGLVASEPWMQSRVYPWRGNVRELRNAVERALALAGAGQAPAEPLTEPPLQVPVSLDRPLVEQRERLVEQFEAAYVAAMLAQHDGNFSRAAAAAGIDRMYFKRLLRKYAR